MRYIVPNRKVTELVEDTEIDLLALPPQFAHLRPDKPTPHTDGWVEWLNEQRQARGIPPIRVRPQR